MDPTSLVKKFERSVASSIALQLATATLTFFDILLRMPLDCALILHSP